MMSFKQAFDNLFKYEAGYVNDKDDKGEETYAGIARHYHPDWQGWQIIDNYKKLYPPDFKSYLEKDERLQSLVLDFYKKEYWDKFKGDELPYIIAEELLEQSVNLGTYKTAGKNLQKALNLLNRNQKLYPDLKVDGTVGEKTLSALKKVNPRRLLKVLNGLQFMRYYNLDIKNPENEKFVGWFDRV
jgi:lysozyme family protein